MAWILRAVAALVALGWLSAWVRIERRRRDRRWVLGPADPACSPEERVSVIVPARDEERNIGACIDSVLAQDHPGIEIVVLDDASTDATWEIVEAARGVRGIRGRGEPPDGWLGKSWALHRAAAQATGDWLLFLDADVRLAPEAVSRLVGRAREEGLGLLTGFGAQVNESFWEKVMQPAVAGMILAGNDLDRVNDPDRAEPVIGNGQLMLFSREAYRRIGGHEAVRGEVIEDVALARLAKEAGVGFRCLVLRELFRVRMYSSLGELWDGWGKNLFAGMHASWSIAAGAIAFTFAFSLLGPLLVVLGAVGAAGAEWLWWGAVLVVLMQAVRWRMDRTWGLDPRYGPTHAPANLLLIALIVSSGLRSGRGVPWKGRLVPPLREP